MRALEVLDAFPVEPGRTLADFVRLMDDAPPPQA